MSIIIEPVVSFVIERIANLLSEEIKFLVGVEDQVNGLLKELTWMQSYLKDAEAKQEEFNEVDRVTFREITKIAYDAEDVVESFILEPPTTIRRKEGFFKKYICICCSALYTHQVGIEVEAIKKRIKETEEMFQRYNVRRNTLEYRGQSSTSMVPQVRSSPYTSIDEHVVGLDEDITLLVQKLTEKDGPSDSTCDILAIVGMGGSGKTTLARKIYNHETIKNHFRWMAWVSVSQEWNAQYILSEISRQVNKQDERSNVESWRIEKLIEELHCFLQDKAYLIVLDDIWQKEALAKILPALPLGKTRSKIIVTTRNEDVVHLTDLRCTIHNPPKLTVQQSWELFSMVAFPNGNFPNFDDFVVLAKQMLEKCDGLPLAIVSLGGLLSRKGSLNEWENVKAVVSSNIMASSSASHQYKGVRDILELSYRELPYQLKPCFLYLGLFPEDMEIPVSMLKRMWIAEGFITRDIGSGVTLEDMASQHMEELIQRYMIQVGRRNRGDVVKTCRIHDLMRDLCITKGNEQGFLEVFSTDATSRQSTLTESRRLAIHLRVDHTLPTQDLHVRSLLVNHDSSLDLAQKTMMVKELAAAFKKYKFLRVLQLCNIQLANDEKALPEEIGQLIFLRYLEIRNSSIYEIPQSINNLCRLLTFDYGVDRGDAEIRIPSDVFNKMERLVCLRFPYRNPIRVLTTGASGTTSKIELNGLKSLQTLWGISSESFRGLEHLSCLKELKIIHVASTEEMSAMWQCPSIRMDRLCKLNLQWEDSVEAQSLEPISHCRHLTRLTLRGRLCMLSNLPYNLSKLNLYQSRLRQDSIPALGNLRHLRWLRMSDGAYEDAKMIIRGNAFPQLVELFLEDRINEILLGMLRLVIDAEVRITCEPNSSFPHMIIDGVISYIRTSDGQLRPIYKSHIQLDTSHAQFRLIYRMQ